MSVDPTPPPAGEEIHLPGGSLQPILLTVGITAALVGLTVSWWLVGFGVLLSVIVIVRWVMDARHEIAELPAELDHH